MAVLKTITAIALISGFTFIYIPDYRCVHHLRKDILAEQCSVVGEFFAAGFFELMEQIFDGEFLFLFAFDVQDDLAVHKHDQTIAVIALSEKLTVFEISSKDFLKSSAEIAFSDL